MVQAQALKDTIHMMPDKLTGVIMKPFAPVGRNLDKQHNVWLCKVM